MKVKINEGCTLPFLTPFSIVRNSQLRQILTSSAYKSIVEFHTSTGRSFTHIENSNGPRVDLCGPPKKQLYNSGPTFTHNHKLSPPRNVRKYSCCSCVNEQDSMLLFSNKNVMKSFGKAKQSQEYQVTINH